MVAIIYTLFDRLSIITPVEQKLAEEIEHIGAIARETAGAIQQMKDDLKEYEEKAWEATHETVSEMQHYDKYVIARSKFGFNALVGLDVQKDAGEPNVIAKPEPFSLKLFNESVPASGSIDYLISFITDDVAYSEAIEKAVRRGVQVRLMLMKPTPDTPPAEARWRDCYVNDEQYETYDEFISEVVEKYRKFWRLERKLHDATPKPKGSFRLLAYDASLSVPMIVVREDSKSSHVDVVYTGFYTALDSNLMPFIEWRGGDYRIGAKFHASFEAKWDRALPFDPRDNALQSPARARAGVSPKRTANSSARVSTAKRK